MINWQKYWQIFPVLTNDNCESEEKQRNKIQQNINDELSPNVIEKLY